VNDQNRFGILAPITPTIEYIRQKIVARTGIEFNHCVILLYRDADDCIGFHQDKTLDLDESAPIASVSLGRERPYALRDNPLKPTHEQQFIFPHGALLLLGPKTNEQFYHSVKQVEKVSFLSYLSYCPATAHTPSLHPSYLLSSLPPPLNPPLYSYLKYLRDYTGRK
jgi:alkylated DNA repair dioxygenase AlkB